MFIEGSDHKVYVVEKVEGISLAINGGRFYYYDLFKAAESPSKLDLSRMIRGHEGETFYSPVFGDVIFEVILENVNTRTYSIRIKYSDYYSDDCYYTLEINGCASKNGICVLFPSKELYEKYPLNPEKAWEEWENMRTSLNIRFTQGDLIIEESIPDITKRQVSEIINRTREIISEI